MTQARKSQKSGLQAEYSEEGSNLRMASERKFSINVRSRVKRLKYFFIYIGAQYHDIIMNYYI